MTTRTVPLAFPLPHVLATLAVIAVALGLALSFVELTAAGIVAAIIVAGLWLKRFRSSRKISLPS